MKPIDPRHWRPLFDAVYEMNMARDHADFATAVIAAMSRLISADLCIIHVIDRSTGRILHHFHPGNPYTPEEIAYYVSHAQDNPFVAYYERTGDTRARRLNDVTDAARYRRSEFFRQCLRRLGFNHCLALPIKVDAHTIAGLTFERRRTNFTTRHCALLDAFAPHFRLAWKRHADPWHEDAAPARPARQQLLSLGLTPREADVLFWMTEGKQNREIATILGRSLETIQEHVGNIVSKLHQENRHAATVFALRHLGRSD